MQKGLSNYIIQTNFGRNDIAPSPRVRDPFSHWLSETQRLSIDSLGTDVYFTRSQGKKNPLCFLLRFI